MSSNIDELFFRLATTYGAAWDRSLGGSQIADVKTLWLHELSGFTTGDVKWALDNLPEHCPNIIKFKNLCREAPRKQELALPPPVKANPEIVAANIAKVSGVMQAIGVRREDPKEWMRRIVRRFEAGEKITPTIMNMVRDGLKEQ